MYTVFRVIMTKSYWLFCHLERAGTDVLAEKVNVEPRQTRNELCPVTWQPPSFHISDSLPPVPFLVSPIQWPARAFPGVPD